MIPKDYLEKLRERSKKSRVRNEFQYVGLQIATMLDDQKHKVLYIKLAKENDPQVLREIAAKVAEKKEIKYKGAYFMKIFYSIKKGKDKETPKKEPKPKKKATRKPRQKNQDP